jgi:hypothetical protein
MGSTICGRTRDGLASAPMADSGGSNGSRGRLWKLEVRKLADETGLEIFVCYFPQYQQVEQDRAPPVLIHRAELAWQTAGEPRVIVNLIAATTTRTGLRVRSQLDTGDTSKASR